MLSRRWRFLLIGLGVVVIASLWRTVVVERDKRRVAKAYEQSQQLLREIEQEKAKLSTELGTAKETIGDQAGDMANLQQQLQGLQEQLEDTVGDLASLQQEHDQLQQQHASLAGQYDAVVAEKQHLEARLSSIKELKLAIRDVRRQVWAQRLAAWRARAEAQREVDQVELASGNRGYVFRDGTSTLGLATRLHVHVLEPESK